ncbi:hypothetical protein [Massilia frigida]|uniref:hypothetical protein n=1 Tax=Massilia frigida TaxID=2609281 RepID=UPI001420D296|nr:hypothetical protein [Massilia frigida]
MKKTVLSFVFLALSAGCANRNNIRMPVYPAYNETSESDYAPYLVDGTSEISG